eukprot:scaffold19245_cov199-Amphora_coffeaeformis.AAC.8
MSFTTNENRMLFGRVRKTEKGASIKAAWCGDLWCMVYLHNPIEYEENASLFQKGHAKICVIMYMVLPYRLPFTATIGTAIMSIPNLPSARHHSKDVQEGAMVIDIVQ